MAVSFSHNKIAELELLRDQDFDAVVKNWPALEGDRWYIERREGFYFVYPEMKLDIVTCGRYPIKPLTYAARIIRLPRIGLSWPCKKSTPIPVN